MILTLQAAETSKGSTVSQPMPYCHPQANPQEGSMNLQMYMVNAPLIGYMTAISARACIIRYLEIIVRKFSRRTGSSRSIHHATYCNLIRFVNRSWIVRHSPMIMNPMTTEAGPPCWKAEDVPTKRPAPMAPPLRSSQRVPKEPSSCCTLTWQSSACVSPSDFGAACLDRLRQSRHHCSRD